MPSLSQSERDALVAEHFIFYVVHHGEEEAKLFDGICISRTKITPGQKFQACTIMVLPASSNAKAVHSA